MFTVSHNFVPPNEMHSTAMLIVCVFCRWCCSWNKQIIPFHPTRDCRMVFPSDPMKASCLSLDFSCSRTIPSACALSRWSIYVFALDDILFRLFSMFFIFCSGKENDFSFFFSPSLMNNKSIQRYLQCSVLRHNKVYQHHISWETVSVGFSEIF